MITAISALMILISVIIGIYVLLSIAKRPIVTSKSEWLSNQNIGLIEKDLVGCKEVILRADSVQVPSKENYKEVLFALIDNFCEGVEYNFLVPASYYDENHEFITTSFQTIIRMAETICKDGSTAVGTFNLHRLPYDVPAEDYPYLFYRFVNSSGDDEILAFRGEDRGVGISEYYRRLETEFAETLLLSCLPYIHPRETLFEEKIRYTRFSKEHTPINLQERRRQRDIEVIAK